MQLRRMKTLVAPLMSSLVGAFLLSLLVGSASAQDMKLRSPIEQDLLRHASKLRRLGTSSTLVNPDTLWIGHVNTTVGYGPYHIGTGPRLISGGTAGGGSTSKPASSYDGVWSFDNFSGFAPAETDSMQGWYAVQAPFGSVGPSDKDDCLRPWFGIDYGNTGNYMVGTPAAPRKTFGVTGYWHADKGNIAMTTDPADPTVNPVAPGWAPITGALSAWCGVRAHGDLTARDVTGTGNYINDDLAAYTSQNSGRQTNPSRGLSGGSGATDHNFPGYLSQMDQLLYRDVTLGANLVGTQSFNISFNYNTTMSTTFNSVHSSQTGYFYNDPLKAATCTDGNFISAAASVSGPVDSFMVYIGSPVEPVAGAANDFKASDGSFYEIFDPQRRWFSEVVKIDVPGTSYKEILTAAGTIGTTAFAATPTNTVINNILDADGVAGNGGKLRIVFRVKTNRGGDDETSGATGFSSGGSGAAIMDDVNLAIAGTGAATLLANGFEGANGDVDNNVGTAATAAWKATGKPPGAWFHVHNLSTLPFDDPCGLINATVRLCNMGGNVLSPGWHDNPGGADKTGGPYGGNLQDQQKYVVSPVINLKTSGPTLKNGMGIDGDAASRKGAFLIADQMWNVYDYNVSTGNGWRIGWQSYPAKQANGVKCWGEMRKDITFNATGGILGCFDTFESSGYDEQLIVTTNAGGIPDSLRCYIESMARCYTLPITSATCSPAAGAHAGGYFDNLSIGLFQANPPALAMAFGSNLNDCFPYNSSNKDVSFFGTQYDTLGARIQTGNNIAPNTSNDLTGPKARECIAGDSVQVVASGDNVRVDMVFRILPGVGNYVTIGSTASGVARRPDTNPRVLALNTDGGLANPVDRFWGAYMLDNGTMGTGGNGATPGVGGGAITVWNPNRWNSARMDTMEQNFFPCDFIQKNTSTNPTGALVTATYMSCYNEADPKYTILGIAKNRCFLNKQSQPVKIKPGQINCGPSALDPGFAYPPVGTTVFNGYVTAGVPIVGTGLIASEGAGLTVGRTYEYTKIIPDGQMTPGTEIQYFFRRSLTTIPGNIYPLDPSVSMTPDTNFVLPNDTPFSSFDGHRWFEVSVLPDRWKNSAFGGTGMACMLVVDEGDRRGDEFVWVSVADSIGLTTVGKRGAHNGWHARPDEDVTVNVGSNDSICRRDNGGQAGSLFDLYETVAGESNFTAGRLGSRVANIDGTAGSYTAGKQSTNGPTETMLLNYKSIVWLGSDVGEDGIGPVPNQTDNDIGLLTNFLSVTGGSGLPRGLLMMGYDLGTALAVPGATAQNTFLTGSLQAGLRHTDYRVFAPNSNNASYIDVNSNVGVVAGTRYGLGNQCFVDNDVFNLGVGGAMGATYENVGGAGKPFISAVYGADNGGTHPAKTLITGWTLGLFGGGFGNVTGVPSTVTVNDPVRKFMTEMLITAFGAVNCGFTGTPVGVGDNPGGKGSSFVNFMNLRSSNPMHSGETRLAFGLAKTEKVELRVYDVTGRMVKTVANRIFAGGQEHVVVWNGTDNAGNHVKSGVYFYQLKTPTWTSQKKLAVLSN